MSYPNMARNGGFHYCCYYFIYENDVVPFSLVH